MARRRNCTYDCNALANQYLILVGIYSAIIAQEIENDEDLGILGSFLVALGEELALASEIRIACKSKFNEDQSTNIEDVFDRGIYISEKNTNPNTKVKRKVVRRVNTKKKT